MVSRGRRARGPRRRRLPARRQPSRRSYGIAVSQNLARSVAETTADYRNQSPIDVSFSNRSRAVHRAVALAKLASARVISVWKLLSSPLDLLLVPAGAVRNVATVLAARDREIAAVDSVVDRLRSHAAAERTAA